MKAYQTTGPVDFFPRHCLLPKFTTEQHASEVYDKLVDSIQNMKKPVETKTLNKMAKALRILQIIPAVTPIQRVDIPLTSESGGYPTQRVANSPPVITSSNPTAP